MPYYGLVVVKSENDMLWFNVESEHMTLFILKFFRNVQKVEKLLGKGFFSVFGFIPDIMNVRLMSKINYEMLSYEEYQKKVKDMCIDIKLR